MEKFLFNFYAEGALPLDGGPWASGLCLNCADFEPFFEPAELRSMNRLTTALLGLVRQQRECRESNFDFDDQTALYLIGDDADSIVSDDACKIPADDQQLLRLLRKISPTKEVGVQASMCAATIGAELGACGKVWAINPSRDSIGLVLDDFRLSVKEGSATKAVICFGVTISPKTEYWPEGSTLREVVRILGVEGWSEAGGQRILETLCADLIRTGGEFA